VSHSKERVEKNCLNCGTLVAGRYCQHCGQENTEPKETFWGLLSHFFNDITHFDGKFFSTVKYLLVRPGYLSLEYIKGRRASYLHPIRMYVFTSAFFFILFFSMFNIGKILEGNASQETRVKDIDEAIISLKTQLPTTKDSIVQLAIQRSIANLEKEEQAIALNSKSKDDKAKDSLALIKAAAAVDSIGNALPIPQEIAREMRKDAQTQDSVKEMQTASGTKIKLQGLNYNNLLAYEEVQKELPESKRDGWLKNKIAHKSVIINEKSKGESKAAISLMLEKFMHTLPQVLFVSLPFFALLLLMLYARRKFYYADHGIFTIHLYCATFILLLIYFALGQIRTHTNWDWISYLEGLVLLGIFFYLYKAMHNFYKQSRGKTILKFLILVFLAMALVILLSSIFFLISLLQIS
jgi:hypothetical protein